MGYLVRRDTAALKDSSASINTIFRANISNVMGGKDPKKESKKDSGSSGRLKDKGKSSSFGGGHSSKGREKERERERGTKYNQAYNDQTVTVQSSSSRKGKEKGTSELSLKFSLTLLLIGDQLGMKRAHQKPPI